MEKVHKDIVEGALNAYMLLGIKSITMNDMATKLGISKKTLYKYVRDKDDLVKQALKFQCDGEQRDIECICTENYNAIEESFKISEYVSKILKNISPSVHYDLEKYHKKTFEEAIEERQGQIYRCVSENIAKGIKEGYYRSDLNIEIISKFYLSKIPLIFDGKIFPPERLTFVQVNQEFFDYHIRGIATEKGIKYLENNIKNQRK
ncbi:MAG: AcrR family transcriptional regulator [Patiriisocius sp.]|jgi:AcrR family transcriptional regulator